MVVKVKFSKNLTHPFRTLFLMAYIIIKVGNVVARLVTVSVLADKAGYINTEVTSVTLFHKKGIKFCGKVFGAAQSVHQSLHIMGHKPGILPGVTLAEVRIMPGQIGIERLAPCTVSRSGTDKAHRGVIIFLPRLAAIAKVFSSLGIALHLGHFGQRGIGNGMFHTS